MKKTPITNEIQNRLNSKQEVFLSTASAEIGSNSVWIDVGLELSLQPEIYNVGYKIPVGARISGTALNEEIVTYVSVRKSDDTQFDTLGTVRGVTIEDDDFTFVHSHEEVAHAIVVTEPTTIKVSLGKSETTESGTINCFVRAFTHVGFDTVQVGRATLWAQKVGDVA